MDAWSVVGERSVDAACELYAVLESSRSSSSPCEVPDILLWLLLPSWRVALVAGDRGLSSGLWRTLKPAATRPGLITRGFHCEGMLGYQASMVYVRFTTRRERKDECAEKAEKRN